MPCPRVDATEVLKFVSRACGAEWAQAGAAHSPRARKGKSLVHPYATHPACTQADQHWLAALVRKLLLDPASAVILGAERSSASTIGNDTIALGCSCSPDTRARNTPVAVNTNGNEQTVPFWFPVGGDYREELHGGDLDLEGAPALKEHALTIPTHYGRIWTRASGKPARKYPVSEFRTRQSLCPGGPSERPKKAGAGPQDLREPAAQG